MNPSVYAQRRSALARTLGPGAIAIVPTALEHPRNRDSDFLFRHDSYFYYLTGFTEPEAWLVLTGEGHSTLFCRAKDVTHEIWDGFRLGPEAAPAALGVDAACDVASLDAELPRLLENHVQVWYPFAVHPGLEGRVASWLSGVRGKARQGIRCPQGQQDLCVPLDEMRLFKDAHEQDIMRRAAAISAQAHVRAMQCCMRMVHAGQDVREFHLDAELLHAFRQQGSQYPAYSSIVAAGANACVLHYRADAAPVRAGELVLIDAGCELDGYASDITRTFPANGRFSGPQRDIYQLVQASQEAAVVATRAGARFTAPHDASVRVLAQGLLDLGLLQSQTHGLLDDVIEKRAYFPFYMHRTSHWLGMDVHDCGSYVEPDAPPHRPEPGAPATATVPAPAAARVLQPGMVLTLEPGLYVRPAQGVPEAFWHIGVRIEDDAIVTADGCELISRDVPVDATEIEALMRDCLPKT